MWIPDDAIEAAEHAFKEWLRSQHIPVGASWAEEMRVAIDAAMPHVVAAQAARLRTMADEQFSKNIQTTLACGLNTAARIIEGVDK